MIDMNRGTNSVILSDYVEGSLLASCKHLFTKATKADILDINYTVWINDLITLNRTWEILNLELTHE